MWMRGVVKHFGDQVGKWPPLSELSDNPPKAGIDIPYSGLSHRLRISSSKSAVIVEGKKPDCWSLRDRTFSILVIL